MEVENVQTLPAMDNWAGAIQHAVTVTRPEPSRAEMAMAIYPQCLANYHSSVRGQDCGYFEGWQDAVAEAAVKHADALRAALEKPKP